MTRRHSSKKGCFKVCQKVYLSHVIFNLKFQVQLCRTAPAPILQKVILSLPPLPSRRNLFWLSSHTIKFELANSPVHLSHGWWWTCSSKISEFWNSSRSKFVSTFFGNVILQNANWIQCACTQQSLYCLPWAEKGCWHLLISGIKNGHFAEKWSWLAPIQFF